MYHKFKTTKFFLVIVLVMKILIAGYYEDDENLGLLHTQQADGSQLCWAHVSRSVLHYFKTPTQFLDITQYGTNNIDMPIMLYGVDSKYPNNKSIREILSNFGNIASVGYDNPISESNIKADIVTYKKPIICQIYFEDGGFGHFVVIEGYSKYIKSTNSVTTSVSYYDPMKSNNPVVSSLDNFEDNDNFYWNTTLRLSSNPEVNFPNTYTPISANTFDNKGGGYSGENFTDNLFGQEYTVFGKNSNINVHQFSNTLWFVHDVDKKSYNYSIPLSFSKKGIYKLILHCRSSVASKARSLLAQDNGCYNIGDATWPVVIRDVGNICQISLPNSLSNNIDTDQNIDGVELDRVHENYLCRRFSTREQDNLPGTIPIEFELSIVDLGTQNVQIKMLEDISYEDYENDGTVGFSLHGIETQFIKEFSAPQITINANSTSGKQPFNVIFSAQNSGGPVLKWLWDFGDGQTSTAQNPTHIYSKSGNYTVTLKAYGPSKNTVITKTNFITVLEGGPQIDFSALPNAGNFPLDVNFSYTNTGGIISSLLWDFGDGTSSTSENPSKTYSTPGQYTVKLTAYGPDGNDVETKVNYISVKVPAPQIDFTCNITEGSSPLKVLFEASNIGGPVRNWIWEFGEKWYWSGPSLTNVEITYDTPGQYDVKLTAEGPDYNDVVIKSRYITVKTPAPIIKFSANQIIGLKTLTTTFTSINTGGPINSYLWDFGDGTTSSEANPTHTYKKPGKYTVKLTATGPDYSDIEIMNNYITVKADMTPILSLLLEDEPAPEVSISATPLQGEYPLNVAFTANNSGGYVKNWHWNFGDGTSSTEQNPTHTYTQAGNYTVVLTAYGESEIDVATETDLISILYPAPNAIYALNSNSGIYPFNVTINTTNTGGPIEKWLWNFGDGTTYEGVNPSHSYIKAGVYNITCSVIGMNGVTYSLPSQQVTVTFPASVLDFTASKTTGGAPLSVNFYSSNGGGSVTSWLWNFGDGTTSTLQNPVHKYMKKGTYTVSLTLSGNGVNQIVTKNAFVDVKANLSPILDIFLEEEE